MRILLTIHQFLPDFSAGTELIAHSTARELRARGHEIQFFTGFPGQPVAQLDDTRLDRYEFDGFPVHRFTHAYVPMGGENNIARLEHDNPLAARFFSRLLDQFKPDLVHAYHLGRISTSIVEAACRTGVPIVFTATDFWFICPMSQLLLPGNRLCPGPGWNSGNCAQHLAVVQKNSLLRRALYRLPTVLAGAAAGLAHRGWLPPTLAGDLAAAMVDRPPLVRDRLAHCSRIIAPSNIMQRSLLAAGIGPEKILRLPYGINLEHIDRHSPKAGGQRLRIGYIGTIAPHKGAEILVKAVMRLPADLPISLSLNGPVDPASDYPGRLRHLSEKDARINFAGEFEHSRISQILAEIDVLVVPSLWHENTPRVIYEAHAAGCAVVASDLGGMSEVVQAGQDGLLFPAGDIAALAKLLQDLCRDRALAARLAAGAVAPMSAGEHVTQLESLYRQLAVGGR